MLGSAYILAVVIGLLSVGFFAPLNLCSQHTSRKLRLLGPVGGEVFQPGSSLSVQWGGTGTARDSHRQDTVLIELSGDGGMFWHPIARLGLYTDRPRAQYDSTFSWVLPAFDCPQCLLRVRQVTGFMGSGDSVGSFSVGSPVTGSLSGVGMSILFSSADSLLAVTTKDSISLWNVAGRQLVRTFTNPYPDLYFNHVRFSHDDKYLVAGAGSMKPLDTARVIVWNVQTGDMVRAFPSMVGTIGSDIISVRDGSISPDGERVLMTGPIVPLIWYLNQDRAPDTIVISDRSLSGDFSPDGKTVAIGGRFRLGTWNPVTREKIVQFPTQGGLVEYSADGRHLLISPAQDSALVKVLDATTGRSLFLVKANSTTEARFARKSQRFVLATGRTAYDFSENLEYGFGRPDTSTYTRSAITPYGQMAAVASTTGKVDLWDISGQPAVTTQSPFSIEGHLPLVVDRDLGGVTIGETKDTTIQAFITNAGDDQVSVNEVVIVSGDRGDFTITSGNASSSLSAGSSASLDLRFSPSEIGLRSVRLEVRTDKGTIPITIRGRGVGVITSVEEIVEEFYEEDVFSGDVLSGLSISVQPNPASDAVTISCTNTNAESFRLHIYDMTGRVIDQVDLGQLEPGRRSITYNVADLSAGVYHLEVRGETSVALQQMIIIH